MRPRYRPVGYSYSFSSTPNASFTAATVPERMTVRRAALFSFTESLCWRANDSTRAMLSGSAPWRFSNSLRLKIVRFSIGFVNSSAFTIGFFPARERKRIVTSTVSLGLAGPISRAPSIGTRSLPASGSCFFGVDIDLPSVGPGRVAKRSRAALLQEYFRGTPRRERSRALCRSPSRCWPVSWMESSSRPATAQDVSCTCYKNRTACRCVNVRLLNFRLW